MKGKTLINTYVRTVFSPHPQRLAALSGAQRTREHLRTRTRTGTHTSTHKAIRLLSCPISFLWFSPCTRPTPPRPTLEAVAIQAQHAILGSAPQHKHT